MFKVLLKIVAIVILQLSVFHSQAQQELKLLTFNVWQEGTEVVDGLDKIRDVILEVNPDIVCFVEVRNYKNEDWTTKIVNALREKGFEYFRGYGGGDVSLISKFPIINSKLIYKGEGSIVNFEIDFNEKKIIVACAHLDYTYYACYLPRGYNGGTPNWKMVDDGNGSPKPIIDSKEISKYNLASERDEQMNAFLNSIKNETKPVILMGDFNEPSHLDWTESTKNLFGHNGAVIKWESTLEIEKAGFTDTYREYFPDEKKNPGITWPSFTHGKKSTSWTPKSDERDRIDFIFYKGVGIKTTFVSLVGPKESYAYDKIDTTHTTKENFMADKLKWPSDHKAVFCVLKFDK